MVFKRKNIHFNIFRPKASSVNLNLYFISVTFHFSTKFTEIFYFSLIETTSTWQLQSKLNKEAILNLSV